MSDPGLRITDRLRVLAVVDDAPVADLIRKVFENVGDEIASMTDLAQGVTLVQAKPPDLAFVDVSSRQRAGLALLHHIKAVAVGADVYAIARPDSLDAGSQALSLGAAGVIVYPPSGDELIMAANTVRARRVSARLQADLHREAEASRRGLGYAVRMANLAVSGDRNRITKQIVELFCEASGASSASIYLPAAEGSLELRRVAMVGKLETLPFSDEMGLMHFAREMGLEVVPLMAGQIASGHVLLGGRSTPWGGAQRLLLALLAAIGATALALMAEKEKRGRDALKDPASSAYTFAYFVDIAGREIDKARRHERRFALATITLADPISERGSTDPGPYSGLSSASSSTPLDMAELVLGAVRDSDVLARVDEREFYLLLPETGGLGAHACRRRVLRAAGVGDERQMAPKLRGVMVGLASYPHDGGDLSKLLRMAKRRAEASRSSVVHRLRLARLHLAEMVDVLLWDADIAQGRGEHLPESPRALELPMVDVLGLVDALITQTSRAGAMLVAVSQREGVSLLSGVRSQLGSGRENVTLHALDIRDREGCEDLEILALVAEHGAYALLGRFDHGMFHGVHAADPLLADLTADRLGELAGVRVFE